MRPPYRTGVSLLSRDRFYIFNHSTAVSRRPCCAVALRRTAWSKHGMASVNQTRPHCVNQMGKTHSKRLAARHGRGTVWARHGHGMLCVNRSLELFSKPVHPPIARPRHLATETVEMHTPWYSPHKHNAISMFLSSVYQFTFESLHCLLRHKPRNTLAPVPSTICDASTIVTFTAHILKWNVEYLRKETPTGRRI